MKRFLLHSLILLGALMWSAPCLCANGSQAAENQALGDAPGLPQRTAFVLFMAIPLENPEFPLAAMREQASAAITESLEASGQEILDPESLLPYLSKWRIRSGNHLPLGFLEDLQQSAGVDRLLVLQMIEVPASRLILWRSLATESGLVKAAGTLEENFFGSTETNLGAPAEAWRAGLQTLLADLDTVDLDTGDVVQPSEAAGRLTLAPVRPVDCTQSAADLATQTCLLAISLQAGWEVIDPGVASACLKTGGVRPDQLDKRGCRLLQDTFQVDFLFLGELISGETGRVISQAITEPLDGAGPGPLMPTSFTLTLRQVDLRSGTLAAAQVLSKEKDQPTGWFGVPIHRSMFETMSQASDQLWAGFSLIKKDSDR